MIIRNATRGFLVLSLLFSLSLFSEENEAGSRAEIVNRLLKWPQDFNAKNVQAVCGLFAPDVIATYPGSPDKNYGQMCQQLTRALTSSNREYRYEPPKVEEILISGDMAVVRLIWTLQITSQDLSSNETIRERGLDVFKRQPDGSWKIAISYAYPIAP